MANANVNRIGQNLGAGDTRALFQNKYLTEVLSVYHTANVTSGRFVTRNITEGKSASFPLSGLASGGFHSVGTEILGRNIQGSQKVITVDDLLISDVFVAKIDELMNYWDVRSQYTTEQGEFLAKVNDYQNLMLAVKAARQAALIPGDMKAGTRIVNANLKTDAGALAAAIFAARTQMDENGIPSSDVSAFLKPAQIALLVLNKETINKLYGGAGSYADGDISAVGGVPLVKTTHLPTMDMSTDTAIAAANLFGPQTDATVIPTKYRGDFSTTAGVVAHKYAVGTVELMGMELEINYDFRRKGTLIVASQARGSDWLRPECSVELATAALGNATAGVEITS